MFGNKKKIEFVTRYKAILDVIEKPFPASNNIPNWYKNMPAYVNDKKEVDSFGDPTATIKKCMPFLDAMTAGYHIPLPCDVWVSNNDGQIDFKWSIDDLEVVSIHKQEQYNLYPIPEGYISIAFKWLNPWLIVTPKGHSCIFKHPTHYDDLPFQCMTGVVDTDKHPYEVNFIFFLKKKFEGLIEKGTPIIQVIPFKRYDYNAIYHSNYSKYDIMWRKAKTVFFDRYKRFFRSIKKYEMKEKRKCPFHSFLNK